MKPSVFRNRYLALVKTSTENPTVENRTATLKAHVQRNQVLYALGARCLEYGFTIREIRKAIDHAKIDYDFDRKYGNLSNKRKP